MGQIIDSIARLATIVIIGGLVAVCAGTGAFVLVSGGCIAQPGQTVECPP